MRHGLHSLLPSHTKLEEKEATDILASSLNKCADYRRENQFKLEGNWKVVPEFKLVPYWGYLVEREPCKFELKTFSFPPASTYHGSSILLAIDP